MANDTNTESDPEGGVQLEMNDRDSQPDPVSRRMDEADLHELKSGPTIATSQDDAGDLIGEFTLPHPQVEEAVDMSGLSLEDQQPEAEENNNHSNLNDMDEPFLDVPIPNTTTGLSPFAYQRALGNRIKSSKLARGGDYDKRAFTPTFVHDCLMSPGSLANILGKGSAEQIIHRMTPALLPGFHAHVHIETEQPGLVQSSELGDYVQGMLIFGEGKGGRDQIHHHYRPYAKRIKVQVELDISVPVPAEERAYSRRPCKLERQRLWAHAWLWSNVRDFDSQFRTDVKGWKMEHYLAGRYAMHKAIKIEEGIGEDYEVGDSEDGETLWDGEEEESEDAGPWVPDPECQIPLCEGGSEAEGEEADEQDLEQEGREVPHGGPGGLFYERSDDAVGKW